MINSCDPVGLNQSMVFDPLYSLKNHWQQAELQTRQISAQVGSLQKRGASNLVTAALEDRCSLLKRRIGGGSNPESNLRIVLFIFSLGLMSSVQFVHYNSFQNRDMDA